MLKLKVKNFGPIKEGLTTNDGWMDFRKVNIFIGESATGKTTVAKLLYAMMELETNAFYADFEGHGLSPLESDIEIDSANDWGGFFFSNELKGYYKFDSEIRYEGKFWNYNYLGTKRSLKVHNSSTKLNTIKITPVLNESLMN